MEDTICPSLDPKLYSIILEKSLHALGLPNTYAAIGGGQCGKAFKSGDKVYKITTDKSEAIESNKLIGKNNNHLANIFNVKKINTTLTNEGVYLIVLEYLNTNRDSIFYEIQEALIELFEAEFGKHLFDILHYYRFDPTFYKNEYEELVNQLLNAHQREKYYYNSLLKICDELKANNIDSLDFQYHNLGLKSNGNLAFFDMVFGDEKEGHLNSVDIGEEIVERVMTYMKNSSAVNIKKKCQLGGNGDGTSTACDTGDISNIELKQMKEDIITEHTSKWNKIKSKKEKIEQIVEFELAEMVDEGIKAYHGTPNEFDEFSTEKIGSSDGREVGGWGLYFTTDYSVANDYAGNGGVMEVDLRNGNYLDLDEMMDDNLANDIINRGQRKGLSEDDIQQFQSDFADEQYRYDITNKQVYEWLSAVLGNNKAASMYLMGAGYLGNKFNDKTNPNAKNYVIFDSNSVKIINSGDDQEELYESDQNTSQFDLKIFDSIKSFAGRKKYADERLQKIGAGSSRIVYRLNDGNVLKLASNKKGLDQNENECGLGQDNYFGDLLAKIVDCDQNNLWVVSQEAKKITPLRFEELTGANFASFGTLLTNIYWDNKGKGKLYNQDQAVVEKLYESDFVHQMIEMMNSYGLTAGDLTKIDSYGEINGDVVLKDYGIDDSTWDKHYDKSKSNRRMYENYFDMNEDVKVEINDLPFKGEVEQAGGKIYSVGGAVRDKILGRDSKDLDLLITGLPLDQLEQILHKYGKVDNVGKSFGIIKFNTPQTGELDIAIPRTEKKNDGGGYQGFDVTSDHTLPIEKDLERRDFTINAIAKDSSGLMIDPYGGQSDIEKKQIKMVNPQAFSDDPLRMIRAVQFAARFNFAIEPNTFAAIQQNAAKIREISPERILIEFDKIVKKGNPLVGAKLLRQTGLYDNIFGVSRGINLADFNTVKTMGEFIYQLIKGGVKNPADFFKNNLKGDIETYNEIKALQIGGLFNGDKKTIFDMYKTSPKSINTNIFGQNFTDSVNYMKTHNIPFSLKGLALNGGDLIQAGYKENTPEIGQTLAKVLSLVYREELPNEREAILNYLKNNE